MVFSSFLYTEVYLCVLSLFVNIITALQEGWIYTMALEINDSIIWRKFRVIVTNFMFYTVIFIIHLRTFNFRLYGLNRNEIFHKILGPFMLISIINVIYPFIMKRIDAVENITFLYMKRNNLKIRNDKNCINNTTQQWTQLHSVTHRKSIFNSFLLPFLLYNEVMISYE